MSLLQNLLESLQANIRDLESVLSSSEGWPAPHLYEAKTYEPFDDETSNPPWPAFSLVQKIRSDLHAMEATVTPTRIILLNQALAASKSAALSAAATLGVTDAISDLGGTTSLKKLATSLQVNENKLGRLLRLLAGDWIYREVAPGLFTNTRHSLGLSKSTQSHYFLKISATEGTISATGLYDNLTNPDTKDSFEEKDVPFSRTVSKSGQTFSQYVMEPENAQVMECVQKGVVPWLNKTTRASLLEDFPWRSLGNARVIDVGCGPGDCAFDILQKAPDLQWTFQDFSHVIEGVKLTIPADLYARVSSGNISFEVQDYFQTIVSRGDVWFLRGVIREYDDLEAIKILRNISIAMRDVENSRLIINEVLCSSAPILGEVDLTSAPSERISQNQSAYYDTANLMTWNTHLLLGGKERSFKEMESLVEAAGLTVTQFYKFRTFTVMIECAIASES